MLQWHALGDKGEIPRPNIKEQSAKFVTFDTELKGIVPQFEFVED